MKAKKMVRNKMWLLMVLALPLGASAQSALDARSLSQLDLRGTARYMGMGGAFSALGGDLSAIGINPGGLGIYRSSEVGVTVDLDFQKGTSNTAGFKESVTQTKFTCNNFGYVGSVKTGSDVMPIFNWGATFNQSANFDRRYRGQYRNLNGSLTNYVAGFTTAEGYQSNELLDLGQPSWNPYYDTQAPWSSILFYNSYLINPTTTPAGEASTDEYLGLWNSGTTGTGAFDVEEKGYVNEYNIEFGGNFSDVVYWGLGFGITDLSYSKSVYYEEDMTNATIANSTATGTETGNGGYGLEGHTHVDGSGWNFKVGLIVRPINELRIGLAVHTPTYYSLQQYNGGSVDYGFSSGYNNGLEYANDGYNNRTDWKLQTPWRIIAGIAGVIGKQAIVSVDYEYRPYNSMTMKSQNGHEITDINSDIDNYYQSTNAIRLGVEYRLSPSWSLRAGYAYETTSAKDDVRDSRIPVYTSGYEDTGLIPSYTLDNSTQYITLGVGYRYKNFYIDAAYVNRHRSSDFHAYTANAYTSTQDVSKISGNNNQIVLGIGLRF